MYTIERTTESICNEIRRTRSNSKRTEFAQAKDYRVRRALALFLSGDSRIFDLLKDDSHPLVISAIADNMNAPSSILDYEARRYVGNNELLAKILKHPNVRTDTLDYIAETYKHEVRLLELICEHPEVTDHTLGRIILATRNRHGNPIIALRFGELRDRAIDKIRQRCVDVACGLIRL